MESRQLALELRDLAAMYAGVAAETIHLDDEFIEHGMDSLDVVEFIMAIQTQYDIYIAERELRYLTTPNQAADYLAPRIPRREGLP